MSKYSTIQVDLSGTHHLKDGQPIYTPRFDKVLKFHAPGLAPVYQQGQWFHINEQGERAYRTTFDRVFGFYCHKSAVILGKDSFHITPQGEAVYQARYAWCGNYQEEVCVVRDHEGQYFHIDAQGTPLYTARYAYVGDFKDHFAVVQSADGQATHIDRQGNHVHQQWYEQLDVFHKDFARAKDAQGWLHITTAGQPLYPQRYQAVEPFYNGISHVETLQGDQLLINETGEQVRVIHSAPKNFIGEVSGDLVGFWKTYALYAAVSYQLFDQLPVSTEGPYEQIQLPQAAVQRLFSALWELGYVEPTQGQWHATDKGQLLVRSSFLADAALMWTEVAKGWQPINEHLQEVSGRYRPSFKHQEKNPEKQAAYYKAIDGYATQDLRAFTEKLRFKGTQRILGVGRSALSMLQILAANQPTHQYWLADHEHALQHPPHLASTPIKMLAQDVLQDPLPACDICLLPRFLHYYPDKDALTILRQVKKALQAQGTVYVLEMILDQDQPDGHLLDINMLIETNGKERTLAEWERLWSQAGWQLEELAPYSPLLAAIKLKL